LADQYSCIVAVWSTSISAGGFPIRVWSHEPLLLTKSETAQRLFFEKETLDMLTRREVEYK
jgi:hypothetical protein